MARKKKARTYKDVTITIKSEKKIGELDANLLGTLKPNMAFADEDFDELIFDECKGKYAILTGERKWIPIKVNKQFGLRVTKNKETGEYRILCTLSKEKLQNMTLRNVGELEAEFGIMVERIRL